MSDTEYPSMTNIPTSLPAQEERRLGKYQLVHKLGQGGMGEVWLARDTVAEIDVALKFLPLELRDNKEEQDRLKSSFRLVEKLQHPAICRLRDLQLDPSVGFFLVMDYFDGITLSRYRSAYFKQHESFPIQEVVQLLTPVAGALDYAHSQKIVHRDIKPANILVSRDGQQIQIIDFQLAWEIRATLSRITQKQSDTSGTYPYMAPELWLGARADAATDQYALAMVAYELLDGQLPYEANDGTTWRDIVTHPNVKLPQIKGVPAHVQQALNRALGPKVEDRPPSCREFLELIASTASGSPHQPRTNASHVAADVPTDSFDAVATAVPLAVPKAVPPLPKPPKSTSMTRAADAVGTGRLVVRRASQVAGCAVRIHIKVDGVKRGSLWIGGELRIEIPAGTHVVEATNYYLGTSREITVAPGEDFAMKVSFHWSGFALVLERIQDE